MITFARVGDLNFLTINSLEPRLCHQSKKTKAPLWNAEVIQMSAIAAPSRRDSGCFWRAGIQWADQSEITSAVVFQRQNNTLSIPQSAHPQRSISNQSRRDRGARDTIGLRLPQL